MVSGILAFMPEDDDLPRDADLVPLGFDQRWELFDAACGERIQNRDAAWFGTLSPAARLAVADDLLTTIRAVRLAAGDWQAVDERAWRETLSERMQQVRAFRSLDEANHGTGPVADAR